MTDPTLARLEYRLARVERHNRILLGLLCAMAVIASISATHAASNIVVADEIRAHRFTLLDPSGRVADDWYEADPSTPNTSRYLTPEYSGWGFKRP